MAVAHSERIAIRRGTDRAREARDIAAARAAARRVHDAERLDQRPPPDLTAGIE
jgi:hypothetical protein